MPDVVSYVIPTGAKSFSDRSVEVGQKRELGTGRHRARNLKEQDEKNHVVGNRCVMWAAGK